MVVPLARGNFGVRNLLPDLYVPSRHNGWDRFSAKSRPPFPVDRVSAQAGFWKDVQAL
jgi:hypothetical protein